jgi:acyl carrier protein
VLPRGLDFCLLASSLSTALGGAGLGAYAAAHHYMDAFARAQSRLSDTPWISVDWDAWAPPKGAADAPGLAALTALAIRPDEGRKALAAILELRGLDRVVVSTVDLHARIERERAIRQAARAADTDERRSGAHARPELDTPYVAPRTPLERTLADIWEKLLGVEPIGVDDNFFKLGGDSLLAIQLGTRLRDTLGMEVPINELFDEPTIAALATRLERRAPAAKAGHDVVEATLSMIENLSDEEVKRMLAEMDR